MTDNQGLLSSNTKDMSDFQEVAGATCVEDMSIACSTILYRDMDVFRALDLIAEDGFSQVDLCIVPGFCPHFDLEGSTPSDVHRLKQYLKEKNLTVVAVTVIPGYFNLANADRVLTRVKRCVDLAAELGVRVVSIPSGASAEPHKWQQSVSRIAAYLRRIADYADERRIQISVEAPHRRTLTETVDDAARFFEGVCDDRMKCTFDTSHVFRGEGASLLEGLKKIGLERINHVHLRDVVGNDLTVTPGRGHADFVAFLSELRECGYTGNLSLELELAELPERRRRSELRFAKRYVEILWSKTELPLDLRIRTAPAIQLVERLRVNPRQEIRHYPKLFSALKRLKSYWVSLKPVSVYDGYWRRRWYLQGRVVGHKPNSVPLTTQPSKQVRVGILGCGYAGSMQGLGFRRLAGVRVVGVCDTDGEKAKALANRLDCAAYTPLTHMLEAEKPDLVSVCTREWQHYEPVAQLLGAGVDVFCEKIMATTYREAQQMVELAKRRGRVLAINYNYRFMPGIQKLKEIINKRLFGELQLINIKVHAYSYHHGLDLVSFLGDEICSVRATFKNEDTLRPFGGTDWSLYDPDILYVPSRNLAAIFELTNGAVAVITSSNFYDTKNFVLSVDVLFDKGAVALTGINRFDVVGRLTWTCDSNVIATDMDHRQGVFAHGYEYCFYKSIESFMNAYILHQTPESPGEQGLFNIRLEKAICKAATKGQKVELTNELT